MAQVIEMAKAAGGTYQTAATSKGSTKNAVSSQWWKRPDDQKFLSLGSLYDHVKAAADASVAGVYEAKQLRVVASKTDADRLEIALPGGDLAAPTHWSFSQAAQLVGAPAGYLRELPAAIAAINLQYGLTAYRGELVKSYHNGQTGELRAFTGANYGRVTDAEVVSSIMKIAGNGTGDTCWKVPGMLDWSTNSNGLVSYNPYVDVTTQTTTLFASDRDVFIFLVDDTHPIEIGKLPDGSPDLVFRGFYAWNSEVGSKSLGLATMLLRGVCCNRILWGVEDFEEIKIRHSKFAPDKWAGEMDPALASYSNASTGGIKAGIAAAKQAQIASNQEQGIDFLTGRGLSAKTAAAVLDAVIKEEGHPAETVWDFVNGITATARGIGRTDERVAMERIAGNLMKKASA